MLATGTNVVDEVDVYNNNAQLPARWRQGASWMCHQAILNLYRQQPKAAGLNESIVDDSQSPPRLLGRPVYENSNMDGALTAATADYSLLHGDFSQFVIQDRIRAVTEQVPLYGATRRPTGQRGVLMHWRVGSDVLVPGAFVLTNHSA